MYRVVLVEDEYWVMVGIEKLFPWEEFGFSVVGKFEYAADAEAFIQKEEPDVVFVDVHLADYSGLDLIERCRVHNCTSKFVIISGHADFSYAQRGIPLGLFDYLLKPVGKEKAEELLKRLRKVLDEEHGIPAHAEDDFTHINNGAFRELVEYITNHYYESLSLNALAEKFGMNANYCSQLFTKYFNSSFSDYVIKIRMLRAKELLQKYSVRTTAELVNYEYVHFNKLFKKYYGVTPFQFKNRSGGEVSYGEEETNIDSEKS